MRSHTWLMLLVFVGLAATGCTATHSIPQAARAGDTVGFSVGWQKDVSRANLTVSMVDANSVTTTYNPNDANVRAVVNLYPDPVSRLVVGTQTQQALGVAANTHGQTINDNITNQDRDWWNTTVYVDLPTTLALGTTQVTLTGPGGNLTATPVNLEIVAGTGSPIGLIDTTWVTDPAEVQNLYGGLERADHHTISFTGSTVPHSIQVEIFRDAGIGVPWVVNPRGDLKNIVWADDGGAITILLTPMNGQTPTQMSDFKFYIAGGVTGLLVTELTAYDSVSSEIIDLVAVIQ